MCVIFRSDGIELSGQVDFSTLQKFDGRVLDKDAKRIQIDQGVIYQ